jgi:hypothetical protein
MLCTYEKQIGSSYRDIVFSDEGFLIGEEPSAYHPRNPEDNPIYGIVADNLETYLALQSAKSRPVPFFVEHELRAFLDCGVLANGFLRVHCDQCGKDRVVAFSCKGRSVCSSCCGRRMVDRTIQSVARGHYSDLVILIGDAKLQQLLKACGFLKLQMTLEGE